MTQATDDEPPPIKTYMDEHGRTMVPAFSLHKTRDEHYTYWTVNLHDHALTDGVQLAMQIFHNREDAERFIAEHKGRSQ